MIIERYIRRELGRTLGAVLAVLALIYASNRFVRFLAEAAAGKLASDAILELLALKAVGHVVLLMPLALFLAVLLALGRLYRDSEVVAMSAGGVGLRRILLGVGWFSLLFAAIAALLSLYVAPELAALQDSVRKRAEKEAVVAAVLPGRFRPIGGGRVLYVEAVDRDSGLFRNVFVEVAGAAGGREVLVARRAYRREEGARGAGYMLLEDGYRYRGEPGEAGFVITRFERHAVRIDEGTEGGLRKAESVPTVVLLASGEPRDAAELQWRISLPLAALLLGLMAVPLARTTPHQGRYARLLTALLIYFIYNNALGVARKLVERGDLAPGIGLWPVHLLVVVGIAALLLEQTQAGVWLRRRLAAGTGRR